MKDYEELTIAFLRASITKDQTEILKMLPASSELWNNVAMLALSHGVMAIIYNEVTKLPSGLLPPKEELLRLFGYYNLQLKDYEKKKQIAITFGDELQKRGITIKILKGLSFSSYYEQPYFRGLGDCDCYLGEHFELGNQIACKMGAQVDFGTYKHSHIKFDGLLIENHHYLTDFKGTKKGIKNEKLLEAIIEEPGEIHIDNTSLACPNTMFNSLFLVRHALGNFLLGGFSLRMIYDWAMLLSKQQDNLDIKRMNSLMEECRIKRFEEVLTSLCVGYLGLRLTNPDLRVNLEQGFLHKYMLESIRLKDSISSSETLIQKSFRILRRIRRMWRYRNIAIESFPMMIWNSFAFSSYLDRNIEISD